MNGFTIYTGNDLLFSSSSGDPERYLVSPSLKLETGKAGSLEFSILPNHALYYSLKQMKSLVKVYWDDDLLFRGRVFALDKNMFLQRKVTCEGDLTFLNDVTMDELTVTETPTQFFARCINDYNSKVDEAHRFAVGNVTIKEKDDTVEFKIEPFSNVLSVIESALTNNYGGYLVPRYVGETAYIDYVSKFETVMDQEIEFAKNLIDFQEELAGDDIFTVLIPSGKEGLTVKDVVRTEQIILPNGTVISTKAGDPKIYIPSGIDEYGTIERTQTFDDIDDAGALMDKVVDFLEDNYKLYPSVLNLTALDFHFLDPTVPFMLPGYKIHVQSLPHQISADYVCTSVVLHLLDPDQNEYTMDDPSQESAKAGGSASASYNRTSASAIGKITSDQIQWNKEQVTIASKNISLLADDLLLLKSDTVRIQGRIIEIGSELTQHQKDIMEGMATIIALNADVVAVDSKILDIRSKLIDIETNVLTLDSKYIGINSDMSEMDKRLVDQEKKIVDLQADGIHINTQFNELEAQMIENGQKVVAIDANVIRLGSGLTEAQQKLIQHGESITAINTDVLSVTGRLTRIESETTEIESNIVTINGREKTLITGGTVEIDGTQYTIVNGMTVMSEGIQDLIDGGTFTYVDSDGHTQTKTLSGEVAVKNLIAGKASIRELDALKATVEELEVEALTADKITTRVLAVSGINAASSITAGGNITCSSLSLPGGTIQGKSVSSFLCGLPTKTEGTDGTVTLTFPSVGGSYDVTFNTAASVVVDGTWSGGKYSVTKNGVEVTSTTPLIEVVQDFSETSNNCYVQIYANGAYRGGRQLILGTQPYNNGKNAMGVGISGANVIATESTTKSLAVSATAAATWSSGAKTIYARVGNTNVASSTVEIPGGTWTEPSWGNDHKKTVKVTVGGKDFSREIDGASVYTEGMTAGEAKFSSAGELYTVSSGNAITPIGTAIPLATYDYYDVGSSTTLYKGNGGAVYDVGASGNWYRAGTVIRPTKRTGTLLGTGRTITSRYLYSGPMQPTGTGATYYTVANATPVYLAGDPFEYYDVGSDYASGITPIGTKSEATTKYDRGDTVTPTRRQGTRINTSPVPTAAYRAGTAITPTKHTDYYTKTS